MLMPIILWVLIFILFMPFYIVSMAIFVIYRLIVNLIVWAFKPDLVSHLTSRDIVFTSDDFDGSVRKNLVNLAVIDGIVDIEAFREVFKKRVLSKPIYNRLNCRPTIFMGYYFWKLQDYKIESHITKYDRTCTEQELKTLAPAFSSEPYKETGPLWAIVLFPLEGNKTAVAFKIHHMNGDGFCFMRLLENYVDPGSWKNIEMKDVKPFSWLHWAFAWFNFPWVTLKAYRLAGIRKGFRPTAFAGDAVCSWTTFSNDKVKTIRKLIKISYASAVAGVLSNALYRLLEKSGRTGEIPKTVRCVVPVPWPERPKGRMSNHVAFVHAELPLKTGLEPFYEFEKNIKTSYISGMHGVVWQFFRGMYVVPSPLLHLYTAWGERKLPPVLFSSVPGPVNDVYLLGDKILESIPVIRLGCTMGVNVSITTYGNRTVFGLHASKEFIPNQEQLDLLLNKYIPEELDFFYHNLLHEEENREAETNKQQQHHIKIDIS